MNVADQEINTKKKSFWLKNRKKRKGSWYISWTKRETVCPWNRAESCREKAKESKRIKEREREYRVDRHAAPERVSKEKERAACGCRRKSLITFMSRGYSTPHSLLGVHYAL